MNSANYKVLNVFFSNNLGDSSRLSEHYLDIDGNIIMSPVTEHGEYETVEWVCHNYHSLQLWKILIRHKEMIVKALDLQSLFFDEDDLYISYSHMLFHHRKNIKALTFVCEKFPQWNAMGKTGLNLDMETWLESQF
jgi:hypothetical protein